MGGKARPSTLSDGIVRTLASLAITLGRHQGSGAIIGGIGVIARGVRRLTRDIDVAFDGNSISADMLAAELARVGIVPRIPDLLQFAAESQVLLMRHAASGVDVDVSLAWLPFELEAIASAPIESIAGQKVPIARAEDLVIYKAIAWRPQDQQDVERLLALWGRELDLERVRRHVQMLSEALEVDRLRDLEAVIDRVLGG